MERLIKDSSHSETLVNKLLKVGLKFNLFTYLIYLLHTHTSFLAFQTAKLGAELQKKLSGKLTIDKSYDSY